MAVPDDDTPREERPVEDADLTSLLDRTLESLKQGRGHADEPFVTSDAPTRMNWSSVTEAEPMTDDEPRAEPPTAASDPSFRFDLGSALARLGGDEPEQANGPVAPAARQDESDADHSRAAEAPADAPPLTPAEPNRSQSVQDNLPQRSTPEPVADDLPQRSTPLEPVADDLPQRSAPPAHDLPQRSPAVSPDLPQRSPAVSPDLPQREAAPEADQLPRRDASAPPPAVATPQVQPEPVEPAYRPSGERGSVFEDAAPAPSLPTQSAPQSQSAARHEPAAPVIPPGAVANLPTLPAPAPIAPAPVSETTSSSPATPDIHAVKSYQLKAQREQRRGRVFGRTLLALFLLGGAVAAALTLGRSYLFPTEWDSTLTPIVNEIQDERGGEFTETVPLEVLPAEEYAPIVLELSVGTAWADRMSEWRALGVAAGSADAPAITEAVVAWRPAIYDPVTNQVIQVADGAPEATEAALSFALEQAYERQNSASPDDTSETGDDTPETPDDTSETSDGATAGVLGVSSLEAINSRAIDRELLVGPGSFEVGPEAQVPLPLVYEFTAIDTLGEPLVTAAGAAATSWNYGDDYPDDVITATDVARNLAVAGPLPDGTEAISEPAALGADNWSMIWRNRLPGRTVDRLSTLVTADAYRVVQRGGTRCVIATLEANSETAAADLLGSMTLWVTNGPTGAAATAALVAPTQIEVSSCDPGPEAGYVVDPGAVGAVLVAQIDRL